MPSKDLPVDPEMRRQAEEQFRQSTKMHDDAMNVWNSSVVWLQAGRFDQLKPLMTYEAYFRGKDRADVVDHIMSISDPERVAQFDALVEEWNRELPRIQEHRDLKAALQLVARAEEIIKGAAQPWLLEKIASLDRRL